MNIGVYGARGIPSTYSGYETFLTVLLPALVQRGHRVTIYCRTGRVPAHTSFEGVRLVSLPAPRSKQAETLIHGVLSSVAARMARHDVVFVVNAANAAYCLFAKASGQHVVLNTDGQEWTRGKWGWAARTYFYGSARLARRATTALVSDSATMQDIYRREFHASSSVIPYCWTELDPADIESVRKLGLERDSYFLMAGRLNPENNIQLVAEAFHRSEIALPLVILGAANYDSPVQNALDRLAAQDSRLILTGHVDDRSTFAALLANARTYVHGHSVGGINPSLIEAMGCGARILALETPFNAEALGDGGTYFTDAKTLEAELHAVASEDVASRRRFRERAAGRCHSEFSLDRVVEAHEELFHHVRSQAARSNTKITTKWERTLRAARDDVLGAQKLKVILDTSRLQTSEASRGIGRYIEAVLRASKLVPLSFDTVSVSRTGRLREFIELTARQRQLSNHNAGDLYHAPTPFQAPLRSSRPWVCTMLDVIPLDVPGYSRTGVKTRVFYRLGARADCLLTLSEHARSRIMDLFELHQDSVIVAPLPPAAPFYPRGDDELARVRARLNVKGAFVVFLADTRAPDSRKRIPWISAVADRLVHMDVSTVVVGPSGTARDLGGSEHLQVVGQVDDDVLATLYTGAECMIYPSAYEGQGLPPLEAMACGTPAVGFRSTSVSEVIGDSGLLVDEVCPDPLIAARGPHSPRDEGAVALAEAVVTLLCDAKRLRLLKASALQQASTFTPARFANGLLTAYRKAIENHEGGRQ